MDIVDIILSITSAFFIIILFNTLSYQVDNVTKKIEDYERVQKIADNVFSSIFSPGSPEYWTSSPETANYIGFTKENYGYEIDPEKLQAMQTLCSSNASLFNKKVLAEGGYSVYVKIKKELANTEYTICNAPSSYNNLIRRTAYGELEGDVAKVEIMLWR